MARDKARQAEYNKAYYAANREQLRAKQNAYRAANQRTITIGRHGLTFDQYSALLEEQGGCCAICETPLVNPHIDHDHLCCAGVTSCGSCVRGLLCAACNHMLGKSHDLPHVLEAGANYLRAHTGRRGQ